MQPVKPTPIFADLVESMTQMNGVDPLRFLSKAQIEDRGLGGHLFVWRRGNTNGKAVGVSLGEWLSRPANFGGEWLIEAGQGAPPGAFCVIWDDDLLGWLWGGIARKSLVSDAMADYGSIKLK